MTDDATLDAVENAIAAVSDWLAAARAKPNTEECLATRRAIRTAISDLRDALDAITDARGSEVKTP